MGKPKFRRDTNFVVSGTGHDNNLWWHKWRQIWRHDNSSVFSTWWNDGVRNHAPRGFSAQEVNNVNLWCFNAVRRSSKPQSGLTCESTSGITVLISKRFYCASSITGNITHNITVRYMYLPGTTFSNILLTLIPAWIRDYMPSKLLKL